MTFRQAELTVARVRVGPRSNAEAEQLMAKWYARWMPGGDFRQFLRGYATLELALRWMNALGVFSDLGKAVESARVMAGFDTALDVLDNASGE